MQPLKIIDINIKKRIIENKEITKVILILSLMTLLNSRTKPKEQINKIIAY